jgi:hypothetical protein
MINPLKQVVEMHGALVMKFLAANTCLYCEPPLVREHLLCFGHFEAMINPLQQFVEMQGAVVPKFMAATT